MNETKFHKEYEKRAQKALEHHLKVLELAHKLPIDEFEEFYDHEIETYGNVLQGILWQLHLNKSEGCK